VLTDLLVVVGYLDVLCLQLIDMGLEVVEETHGLESLPLKEGQLVKPLTPAVSQHFEAQLVDELGALDAGVGEGLLGEAEVLVGALATLLVLRLLHEEALAVVALNLVLEVVSVVLGGHGVVALLQRLVHEVILLHIVSEGLVAARVDEDAQLGVGPAA